MRFTALLVAIVILFVTAPTRADKVDSLVEGEMAKHQIAGISLMVIKSGRPLKSKGYGVANREWNVPVTKDTVFEIGSITKQFTAACILLLAQEGKLSLDDHIEKHLKNTPPAWENITIRNLLTHTSGIKNYTALEGFELTKHLTQQQFIEKMGAVPLTFAPGDSWSYSNSGFSLLGYIIENVSGKNYWEFLHDRIFQPLGMTNSGDRLPSRVIPLRAAGYELANGHPINRDYELTDIFSAGAVVSTVVDMAKWDAALAGDMLLNDVSKKAWWSPIKLNNGKYYQYGFGWFLDPLGTHKNIGHGGATSGFSASNQRFPDDDLDVILLSNVDETGLATEIAKKVAKLYLPEK